MSNAVDDLLEKLHIPSYNPIDPPSIDDAEVQKWNSSVQCLLASLIESQRSQDLETDGVALAIAKIAPLASTDVWIQENTRKSALSVLEKLKVDAQVVRTVLEKHIKPIFQAHPHPLVQPATGRALPRGAGGPAAAQDQYNEQTWKEHPGIDGTVMFCISRTEPQSFESLWHLIVPPVMTFLDDFKAAYKLKGVRLASSMLNCVPVELLKKTGIDKLFSTSLSAAMILLHDPLTPPLIRETVPTALKLIEKTTIADSEERFNQLSDLIGEGIIGGIWVYSRYDEPDTIEASMDVLPQIVRTYGVGTARFLNGLVPQCTFLICTGETRPEPTTINLSAMKALLAIIQECQSRCHRFRTSIFVSVSDCWLKALDLPDKKETSQFEQQVIRIYALLLKISPILKPDYERSVKMLPKSFLRVMPSSIQETSS